MKIRDVMTRKVLTVLPDDDLEIARQTMIWGGFRHLPVSEKGVLAGIISERDIFQARGSIAARDRTPHVRDVMRVPVETAAPDEEVELVATRMASQRVGCMPVVEDGQLVGVVTSTDLLAQMGQSSWARGTARMPAVSTVMSADPPTAKADELLADAAARMARHHIRHLPVVDAEGRVIAMLSDRDILRVTAPRRASRSLGPDLGMREIRVSDAMTEHPHTIGSDASIAEAMPIFVDRRFGALPVVDANGFLKGILSYVDVLAHIGGGTRVGAENVPRSIH